MKDHAKMAQDGPETLLVSNGDGEILIARSENPMCVTLLFDSPQGGIDGCVVYDSGRPLQQISDLLAMDRIGEDEGIGYIHESLPNALARRILSGAPVVGYSFEQVQEMKSFIERRTPRAALEWMSAASLSPNDTFRWVQFFSSGDREARAQAVWALPVHAAHLLRMPDLIKAIDARQEVMPAILLDISKHFAGHEGEEGSRRTISSSAFVINHFLNQAASRDEYLAGVGRRLLKIESVACREITDAEGLKKQANSLNELFYRDFVHAAMVARSDQLPQSLDGVIALVQSVRAANTASMKIGITLAPFLRRFARTSADGWGETLSSLPDGTRQGLLADYVNSTSARISSAIIVNLIREMAPPGLLEQIQSTAERVWAREEVSGEEAKVFLTCMSLFKRHYFSQKDSLCGQQSSIAALIRGAIGENASLKQLDELQARWHHNHMLLESKAMSDSGELKWTALAGQIGLSDGILAVELNGSAALNQQGKRERHCVGGHAPRILSSTGNTAKAVFSIEQADGQILSTIEVHGEVARGSGGKASEVFWRAVEHKAARNQHPSPRALLAGRELVAKLNELPARQATSYLDRLLANPGSLASELQAAVANFSLNPTNPAIPEIVLQSCDMVLPHGLRGKDIDQWVADISASAAGSESIRAARETIENVCGKICQSAEWSRMKQEDPDSDPSPV